MASRDQINVSRIIQQLPAKLQNRFHSLGKFVRGVIEEEYSKSNSKKNLSKEDIELIQLVVLIYSLKNFFKKGSFSAKQASEIFEDFGMQGFQIGSSMFTKNNENSRRGNMLAKKLDDAILGSSISEAINESQSMRFLVIRLLGEIKNGE